MWWRTLVTILFLYLQRFQTAEKQQYRAKTTLRALPSTKQETICRDWRFPHWNTLFSVFTNSTYNSGLKTLNLQLFNNLNGFPVSSHYIVYLICLSCTFWPSPLTAWLHYLSGVKKVDVLTKDTKTTTPLCPAMCFLKWWTMYLKLVTL